MEDLTQQKQTEQKNAWCKAILFAGMMLFAFYASTHMVAAGDTWVAMACGRHFANHGVDTVEPFSFNSHKAGPSDEQLKDFPEWTHGLIRKWHPTGWINQNWLTHLIFYKLATWFGKDGEYNYDTLVYWKFVLFGLTVFCVYATGRILGASSFLSAIGACLAMVVGRTFYDIRPACYSNLLVPVLFLIFVLTVYKNYKLIWLLIPLVIFWANVHGGYIYMYIMMVPFVGVHLLLNLKRRWSICLGMISLWLVLYLMSYKFLNHEYYLKMAEFANFKSVSLVSDKMLYFWLILAIAAVTLACIKKVQDAPFYAYYFVASAIYFMCLIVRFLISVPKLPTNYQAYKPIYDYFITSSQMGFIFMALAGTTVIAALAFKKEWFVTLPIKGIYHTIAAAIASFIAMIILNPFHFTNLTHTFEISISKHAASWRSVNEWRPAFDFMDKSTNTPNPVGEQEWFGFMCILTIVVLTVWLFAFFMKPKTAESGRRNPAQIDENEQFEWPKIDLAMIILSFLTMYMAIRSRRFIALAAPAAFPAIMMLIQQCWQMITTNIQSLLGNPLAPIRIPAFIQKAFCAGLGVVIVVLGIFWGSKYKHVYTDAWPNDDRYTSTFMRMTASFLKPFEVCQFINDNHMTGRVFNYWTEGGAVAFGENPDPETGEIPLKLFMDGRAQAAYNHETFKLWQEIFSGGDAGKTYSSLGYQLSQMRKRGQTNTDNYKKYLNIYNESLPQAGQWIDEQLENYDVWVVLMPKSQQDSLFMKSLMTTKKWKTAYIDNVQHMLVNIESEKGKDLINKILTDQAVFPDKFSKDLTTAMVIIENNYQKRSGDLYDLVKGAFDEHPYPSAALALTRLSNSPVFGPKVAVDMQTYLEDFLAKQAEYKEQDGYFLRLYSAEVAALYLSKVNKKEEKKFREIADTLRNDSESIKGQYIW